MIINPGELILDYMSRPAPYDNMIAAGYKGATRYFSASSTSQSKCLHIDEYIAAKAFNFAIIPNYEWYTSRPLEGKATGIIDGNYLVTMLTRFHFSIGQIVLVSFDQDYPLSALPTLLDYANAIADILEAAGYYIGIYGRHPILNAMMNRSRLNWRSGSYSFDHGVPLKATIHLQQKEQVYNANADVNHCITSFDTVFGDLKYTPNIPTKPDFDLRKYYKMFTSFLSTTDNKQEFGCYVDGNGITLILPPGQTQPALAAYRIAYGTDANHWAPQCDVPGNVYDMLLAKAK